MDAWAASYLARLKVLSDVVQVEQPILALKHGDIWSCRNILQLKRTNTTPIKAHRPLGPCISLPRSCGGFLTPLVAGTLPPLATSAASLLSLIVQFYTLVTSSKRNLYVAARA